MKSVEVLIFKMLKRLGIENKKMYFYFDLKGLCEPIV